MPFEKRLCLGVRGNLDSTYRTTDVILAAMATARCADPGDWHERGITDENLLTLFWPAVEVAWWH